MESASIGAVSSQSIVDEVLACLKKLSEQPQSICENNNNFPTVTDLLFKIAEKDADGSQNNVVRYRIEFASYKRSKVKNEPRIFVLD